MATKIIMPKLGFDMSSGKVVRWLKQEGDSVRRGEPVLEIETDKATVSVEAEADGVLSKILVKEGDVPVGEAVGEIGGAGKSQSQTRKEEVTFSPRRGGPTDKPYPTRQMDTPEPPSDQTRGAAPPPPPAKGSAKLAPSDGGRLDASPLAKRMAAELGIDLQGVKGSGPNGRITKEDIEAFQATKPQAAPAPTPAPEAKAATVQAQPAGVEKPLSRMRQTIARRMAESKGPIPQFYLTSDVGMAAALALVNQLNAAGKDEDLRVSPLTLVIKACVLALQKFPNLNASFAGDKLITHETINIGVAVAVEGGLITPV
ncbi:MAG: 2-oxo acid dehydrogenase subunit E2, partial [Chloroflexi bacterium]|nr:2-oxo acid dehydrogenase subunit E2 [Chloroflexota bacterium]